MNDISRVEQYSTVMNSISHSFSINSNMRGNECYILCTNEIEQEWMILTMHEREQIIFRVHKQTQTIFTDPGMTKGDGKSHSDC